MAEGIVYLMSDLETCTVPCGGIIRLSKLNIEDARNFIQGKKLISCITNQELAQILSKLLNINVQVANSRLNIDDIGEGVLIRVNSQVSAAQLSNPNELQGLVSKGVIQLFKVLLDPYPC